MENSEYQSLIDYIVNKTYPEEFQLLEAETLRKSKEYFRKKAQSYLLVERDGKEVLGYKPSNSSDVRIVLMKGEDEEAIRKVHEDLGHPGVNATYAAIKPLFFWKAIANDVIEYIKTCENCQKSAQFKLRPPALRPVPPPKLPFQVWGLDLTMLPESAEGYRYLAVAVDHLTKFVEVKPLKGKDAPGIRLFLDELCARYGFPLAIITDQGKEFCNSLIDGYCHDHDIQHRKTSAYHPQSNGLTERMNGTLKSSLRKLRASKSWPESLPTVLRGIRSRVTRSTGYSPFELVYSFVPRVVSQSGIHRSDVSEELLKAIEKGEDMENWESEIDGALIQNASDHSERLVKARDSIIVEKENQKRAHDAKYEVGSFKKGDLVKLQDTRRNTRKGENLGELFSGPYLVASITNRNTAALINQKTGERVKKFVSFARLAPYHVKSSKEVDATRMNDTSEPTKSMSENEDDPEFAHVDAGEIQGERNQQRDRFMRQSIESSETMDELMISPPLTDTNFKPLSKSSMSSICSKLGLKSHGSVRFGSPKQSSTVEPPSRIAATVPDGNCLFRALSLGVSGSQGNYASIRKIIVDEMKEHSDYWSRVIAKPVSDYLKESKMEKPKKYGTVTEILVFANLIERDISVWTNYGSESDPHFAWKIIHIDCTCPNDQEGIYLKLEAKHYETVLSI